MKQLLIEIDPEMAERIERIAPSRTRRRSEFIRAAIRKALWEIEERATAEAYGRQPDTDRDAYLEPEAWEVRGRRRRK